MKYGVVIEKAESNYSAFVPDLPGCIAAEIDTRQHGQPERSRQRDFDRALKDAAVGDSGKPEQYCTAGYEHAVRKQPRF